MAETGDERSLKEVFARASELKSTVLCTASDRDHIKVWRSWVLSSIYFEEREAAKYIAES